MRDTLFQAQTKILRVKKVTLQVTLQAIVELLREYLCPNDNCTPAAMQADAHLAFIEYIVKVELSTARHMCICDDIPLCFLFIASEF